MRCIFCKQEASLSRSVEHIIPETLGNREHILPRGVVCDDCNNYFARKIEKPLLETVYFNEQRFRAEIPNKRGRPASVKALHLESALPMLLAKEEGSISLTALNEEDNSQFIESLRRNETGRLIVPIALPPDAYLMSRFLGKVALEILASRVLNVPGGLDEIVDKPELDLLREYVRRGNQSFIWPYSARRLYAEDSVFVDSSGEAYEVLHEYMLAYVGANILYCVLALFGVEYAINFGGPSIESYQAWLALNGGKSPLYRK